MSWLVNSLQWYFVLFAVGLIFIPFSQKLFGSFIDKGYAFSKTVGIILITYSVFVLGVTRLFPYGWLGIMIVTTFLGSLNCRVRKKNYRITKTIVIEELLFLCSFLFLSFIRSQEPSIHGLEKFMDSCSRFSNPHISRRQICGTYPNPLTIITLVTLPEPH